jgi:hypothetical protein
VVATVSPREGLTYDPTDDTLRLNNPLDQPLGMTCMTTLIPDLWSSTARGETLRLLLGRLMSTVGCLGCANRLELAQTPNDAVGRYSRRSTPLGPAGRPALIACGNFV